MSSEEKRDETVAILTPLLISAVPFIGRERSLPNRLARISIGSIFLTGWASGRSGGFQNQDAFVVQVDFGCPPRRIDGPNPLPVTSGPIILQSEGAEIFYRQIEFKPITSLPPEFSP